MEIDGCYYGTDIVKIAIEYNVTIPSELLGQCEKYNMRNRCGVDNRFSSGIVWGNNDII